MPRTSTNNSGKKRKRSKSTKKKPAARFIQPHIVKKIAESGTNIGRLPRQTLAVLACCVEQFVSNLATQAAKVTATTQISQVRVKDVEAATNKDAQFDFVRHLFQAGTSSSSSSSSSFSSASSSSSSSSSSKKTDNSVATTDKHLNDGTEAAWDMEDDAVVSGNKANKAAAALTAAIGESNPESKIVLIRPDVTLNDEEEIGHDY
jgi:hypothetical protein